jgi:hypothetical protein
MTKENRKQIRARIIAAVEDITSEQSARESVVTIGGHEISRRLVYAGCSQWNGCDRDWDETQTGWAWVVDDQYRLTVPALGGFDGHNFIERQTPFYLQDGYDEQTAPEHDGRDSIDRVPNRILIEIARGLVAAQQEAEQSAAAEDAAAAELLAAMSAQGTRCSESLQ